MYNSRENMTSVIAMDKLDRSKYYTLNLLKGLVNKELLEWHGS